MAPPGFPLRNDKDERWNLCEGEQDKGNEETEAVLDAPALIKLIACGY